MCGGRWPWLLLVTGCRFGFAELRALDAADDASVGGGGDDSADLCAADRVQLGAWGTPQLVSPLNSPSAADEDATVAADGLELFFVSGRSGNSEIYRSSRLAIGDPWGMPSIVPELSDPANESTPALSQDALIIWFSSLRAPSLGMDDIWVATRPDRTSSWTAPSRIVELSSAGGDRGPSIFDQGLSIAFHSNRSGGVGGNDIYIATRASISATWNAPALLGVPNTGMAEQHPWVSPCGLVMTFHSNRSGVVDLYQVTRASQDDPWGTAVAISELDDPTATDKDLQMSPDRRYALFSSDRTGGYEIYEVSR